MKNDLLIGWHEYMTLTLFGYAVILIINIIVFSIQLGNQSVDTIPLIIVGIANWIIVYGFAYYISKLSPGYVGWIGWMTAIIYTITSLTFPSMANLFLISYEMHLDTPIIIYSAWMFSVFAFLMISVIFIPTLTYSAQKALIIIQDMEDDEQVSENIS